MEAAHVSSVMRHRHRDVRRSERISGGAAENVAVTVVGSCGDGSFHRRKGDSQKICLKCTSVGSLFVTRTKRSNAKVVWVGADSSLGREL